MKYEHYTIDDFRWGEYITRIDQPMEHGTEASEVNIMFHGLDH